MKEFCLSGEQEDERGRDKEAHRGREAEDVGSFFIVEGKAWVRGGGGVTGAGTLSGEG